MEFSLLGIPIYTLTKFVGMGESVETLRNHQFVKSLQVGGASVVDRGDVPKTILTEDEGPSNLRNFAKYMHDSEEIARAVSRVENEEQRFIFLGGECSLILGAASGLQRARKRKLGVLWLDSHGDFNTPATTPSGFIGGMCLAMACGKGPPFSSILEDSRPAIHSENVVHAASRALDPPERIAMIESGMTLMEMVDLRRQGVVKSIEQALSGLEDSSDEFILHVDIDCTDPVEIPAVSFPSPHGLSLLELRAILALCRSSERLKAVDLAAYNSRKDVDGASAGRILETFTKGLGKN